jgi:hypothetical protein
MFLSGHPQKFFVIADLIRDLESYAENLDAGINPA